MRLAVSSSEPAPVPPALSIRSGVAVVVAVLANLVLVFVADTLTIAPGFRALTVPPVAVLSALGAGGAAVVYWLAHRYSGAGDRTFLRVAGAALALSVLPDLALLALDPAATPVGVLVLVAMHVVVAGVAVGSLVAWRADT